MAIYHTPHYMRALKFRTGEFFRIPQYPVKRDGKGQVVPYTVRDGVSLGVLQPGEDAADTLEALHKAEGSFHVVFFYSTDYDEDRYVPGAYDAQGNLSVALPAQVGA